MNIRLFLMLLGGLALFLYGMQMMSTNLETAAGSRMKDLLERLTANHFLGVLAGAVITAVIQSSSATTVMVVGFVNSGLMSLQQAVWIIMGANIGTTITGQLIALDMGVIAPFIAFIGVVLIMFVKNKKATYIGGIIAGLGILFIGMGMMSDAMIPLQDSETFIRFMTTFRNPLPGILAGALFTAVIQSSSASVGILQALMMSGLIGLDSAVYVLFGQNIGTCITAVLASIGTSRNAKRTTVIHLLFNIIGTCIFVLICITTPFTSLMQRLTPTNPAAQLANVHTTFNVVTTLLLLPFGTLLAKASAVILPDKPQEKRDEDKWFEEILSTQHVLGTSIVAINSLKEDTRAMLSLTVENLRQSFDTMLGLKESSLSEIEEREEKIDLCNVRISRKISKALSLEHSAECTNTLNQLFLIIGNIERVGDHAMNLAGYASLMRTKGLTLSGEALSEITQMKKICLDSLQELLNAAPQNCLQILGESTVREQQIDDTTALYRNNQINRIKNGSCDIETSILYSEMLTDYERIGDHVLNIAQAYARITN